MKLWAKLLIAAVAILLIIQIPIFQPDKNYSEADPVDDIAAKYNSLFMDDMDIYMDFQNACYDCHSNYTEDYPWYYAIQPVSWWMDHHIKKAKDSLNFSEFANYTPQEAAYKLKLIHDVMEDHSMPLKSYLWMHDEAKLDDDHYRDVAEWAKKTRQKVLD